MNKLKALLALALFAAVGSAAFAQVKVPLIINASEGPAQVILSGKLIGIAAPNLTANVIPGRYDLIVRKSGMPEFRQTIVVSPPGLTVNAPLGVRAAPAPQPAPQPAPPPVKALFSLTVNAAAPGAQVSVNGTALGAPPARAMLEEGAYQVSVTAPGYEPYQTVVQVRGNTVHDAALRQVLNRLTVNSAPQGADVFVNGSKVGAAPMAVDLAPGTYNVRVAAPGFQDFNAAVSLNSPQTIVANLPPLFATITVNLPSGISNKEAPGSRGNSMELYIDGIRQNGLQAQVPPGMHRVRLSAGLFVFESAGQFDAGRSYTVEPAFSLNIR